MSAPSREYLKTKVMTASPEMLTLMLWDGAIRFAEQGKQAIGRKDIEGSYKALLRSQRIVTELTSSLRHDVNPELCGTLAGLYNFVYRRLVDANLTKNPHLVDDALEIMRHQRQTWVMLMDKLTQERANEAQATVAANADALCNAESIPQGPMAGAKTLPSRQASPGSAARRAYPAIGVQPAAHTPQTLSVEG